MRALPSLVWCPLLLILVASGYAQTPTLPLPLPASGLISAGGDHTLAVQYGGTARAWGDNTHTKLGVRDSAALILAPTVLKNNGATPANLTGIAFASAGTNHSLVISTAGVLRAAGLNDSGQLGDGTTTRLGGYATISGITNAVSASAGRAHSIALKSDGTVWAWGNNAFGQVGNNSTTNRLTPQQITPAAPVFPNTFKAVSAGADHSLALRNDGTVWAWGANTHGQLGDNSTTARTVPVQVRASASTFLTGVTAIAAGDGFSLALLSDGTMRAWGRGDQGQLGHDDDSNSLLPIQPTGLGNGITAISAGDAHALARKSDGTVRGWGSNFNGELGGLVPAAWFVPQPIAELANVALIDAGVSHSVAVRTDGAILAWGNPTRAALGTASRGYESIRVQIRDVKTAAAIYAGGDQAAVVRTNWLPYLFGRNADAQLATGGIDPVVAPARLLAWPNTYLTTPPAYAFGAAHTLALIDGKIYAAGDNSHGQLGDGTLTDRPLPVEITIPGAKAIAIAAGWHHSLALLDDNSVVVWGRNDAGQLGLGASSATPTLLPTPLPGLVGVQALAAGESHSLALTTAGTVFAWGSATFGQLGDNTTLAKASPAQVKGSNGSGVLTGITGIAAGANHSLAVNLSTKRAYAWGRGTYGQVGHSATSNRLFPFILPTTDLKAVAAGENHSLVLRGDGRVMGFGLNALGQLGDATTTNRSAAVLVNSITTTDAITAIAAGFNSSYALFNNGTLFGWGDSSRQQLGYAPSRITPIAWRLTNNSADSDADGMINTWETAAFPSAGGAGNVSPTGDSDADGLLQIQEHYYGSPPSNQPAGTVGADNDGDLLNDFADSDRASPHNGNSYTLSVLAGNSQFLPAGASSLAVTVQARLTNGNNVGAVLPVRILSADAGLPLSATTPLPVGAGPALDIATDTNGIATFYFRQSTPAVPSIITFQIGAEIGEIYIFPPPPAGQSPDQVDSDSDGLSDVYEIGRFGSLRAQTASGDPDGDAYTNATEQTLGMDPLIKAEQKTAPELNLVIFRPGL